MTNPHEEYLRRNLRLASAYGALAAIEIAIVRLEQRRQAAPKWLRELLEGAHVRLAKLPTELVQWRDTAPDAPSYARPSDR